MSVLEAARITRAPMFTLAAVGVNWGGLAGLIPDIKAAVGASDADPAKLLFDPLSLERVAILDVSFLAAATGTDSFEQRDNDRLVVGLDTDGDGQIDLPLDSFLPITFEGSNLWSTVYPTRMLSEQAAEFSYSLRVPPGAESAALVFDYWSTGETEVIGIDSVLLDGTFVPEPSTITLLALAAVGIGAFARRRRRA